MPKSAIIKQPVASVIQKSPSTLESPATAQTTIQVVDTGDFGAAADQDIMLTEADLLNAEISLGFEDSSSEPPQPTTEGIVQKTAQQLDTSQTLEPQVTTASIQTLESDVSIQEDTDQTLTDGDINSVEESLFTDNQGDVIDTSDIDPTLTDNDVDTATTEVDIATTEEDPDEESVDPDESSEQQETESIVASS